MREPMSSGRTENQAKRRFFLLTAFRLTGALLAAFGLLIMAGRVDSIHPESQMMIGSSLFLAGLIEALWIPIVIARMWKAPDK